MVQALIAETALGGKRVKHWAKYPTGVDRRQGIAVIGSSLSEGSQDMSTARPRAFPANERFYHSSPCRSVQPGSTATSDSPAFVIR